MAVFPLESNLFWGELSTELTPLQSRQRTTDGALHILELAPIMLWSASGIRCRITTNSEMQLMENFFFDNRNTSFQIYDPTRSQIYLEAVGTGDAADTTFSLKHKFVVSGTLKVYLNGTLKTETSDYTVNYATGVITFNSAPGGGVAITASYRYRKNVLFDGGLIWAKRAIPDGDTVEFVGSVAHSGDYIDVEYLPGGIAGDFWHVVGFSGAEGIAPTTPPGP